ncbi:MAG: ATP-binding protein [Ferruginibacter sp.]
MTQELYNNLPCIFFSSSLDGLITHANNTLCKSLGYTVEELIGQKLELIFTLSTRIFQQTHFYPLLELEGVADEIYITLKSKEGEDVPILVNAIKNDDESEAYYKFAGIAITKRKRFEEEIIAAKKLAENALNENTSLKFAQEQLQKHSEELDIQIGLANLQNKELRQFNHLATHSLQEPLRKLLYYSNQIIGDNKEYNIKNSILKIKNASENLNLKVKGLQQYVWLANEKLECENLDLFKIILSAKDQLKIEYPNISVNIECEKLPVIKANKEQIQYLIHELFLNSIKFRKSENDVNIKIFASTLLLNKFRQLSGKYKYVEYLKLEIKDDGLGFDDKYQDQAFDFFRKLHSISNDGAGIGLSLCKKIIENHGGSISLESEIDLGTNVIIYLVLNNEKAELPN